LPGRGGSLLLQVRAPVRFLFISRTISCCHFYYLLRTFFIAIVVLFFAFRFSISV
jgi:hypothetical protein